MEKEYMEAKTHIRQLRTIANSNNIQSHFMITGLLKRIILLTAAVASITVGYAMPHNIAHSAKVTASSCRDAHTLASNAVDGKIRILNKGEWVSKSAMTFWGEIDYPWIQLDWDNRVTINKVILYDRPVLNTHIAGGVLKFSDGTSVLVNQIPDDGSPKVVEFSPRHTDFVRFEVTDADGIHVGLSEIEVYPAPDDYNSTTARSSSARRKLRPTKRIRTSKSPDALSTNTPRTCCSRVCTAVPIHNNTMPGRTSRVTMCPMTNAAT